MSYSDELKRLQEENLRKEKQKYENQKENENLNQPKKAPPLIPCPKCRRTHRKGECKGP